VYGRCIKTKGDRRENEYHVIKTKGEHKNKLALKFTAFVLKFYAKR
jgi:hypothetical protein